MSPIQYYAIMFVLGCFVGVVARVAYAEGERLLQVWRFRKSLDLRDGKERAASVEKKLEGYEEEYEWLN